MTISFMTRARVLSRPRTLFLLGALAFLAALALAASPAPALAVNDALQPAGATGLSTQSASGTWGTCKWDIDGNGVLTVHAGKGAEQTYGKDVIDVSSPWSNYESDITEVRITEKVIAPKQCNNLFKSLSEVSKMDLSGLDTSNMVDTRYMFWGCSSLRSLDLSKWNTSNLRDASWMFLIASKLETLDVATWDTSRLENADCMFMGCESLASVDVGTWNTANLTSAHHVFNGCGSLTSIDLASWDTSKLARAQGMFRGCGKLKTIFVGDGWTTSAVESGNNHDLFRDCTSLVGGNGTKYDGSKWNPDASRVDLEYARVDAPGQPGFLTLGKIRLGRAAVTAPAQTWTGKALKPIPTVKLNGKTLKLGAEFVVSGYANNVSAGMATVTVKGVGSYTGTAKGSFMIAGIANGKTATVGGSTYKVADNAKGTVYFHKAPKSKKSVTVPATVTIMSKSYKVVGISKGAFKKCKAKKVAVKTALLTKASVKGCFKGSKVKTVKAPKAKRSAYKKIFAKKNCGKKVKVK